MTERSEPAARLAGIDLVASPTSASVRSDPALTERALGNLITNARPCLGMCADTHLSFRAPRGISMYRAPQREIPPSSEWQGEARIVGRQKVLRLSS